MSNILLQVDGVNYEFFTSISVSRSLEAISGAFEFSVSSREVFPIRVGQSSRVLIANVPVVSGFIEDLTVDYGPESHGILIAGRDRTADVIDSSVIGELSFDGDVSLKQIIESSISNLGITNISVIDAAGNLRNFPNTEREAAEIGEPVFNFLEKYARKRQVFLTTDGAGNIKITRASGNLINTNIIHEIDGANNNVLSASVSYDYKARFNRYFVDSQGNPSVDSDAGTVTAEALTNQRGDSGVDPEIRSTRVLVINSESSMDGLTGTDRAVWEANIRRARSKVYTVTVQGFLAEKDGRPWEPDFLVNISDDFAGIKAQMLIKGVTYNFNLDDGSTTTLEFVVKDAYTLQALQTPLEEIANPVGEGFIEEAGVIASNEGLT